MLCMGSLLHKGTGSGELLSVIATNGFHSEN